MEPPGRFLQEDANGMWLDIGDARANRKTGQALREAAPTIRQELEGGDAEDTAKMEATDSDSDDGSHKDEPQPDEGEWIDLNMEGEVAWQANLEEFKQFQKEKKKNKNKRIPERCSTEMGNKLAVWVSNQRTKYKEGDLSQERIGALNAIDFCWTVPVPVQDAKWQEKFELLKQYKKDHGDCLITQRSGSLGKWVNAQRRAYKKKGMPKDRMNMLESIGFVFDASSFSGGFGNNNKDFNDAMWQEKFELLKQFKEEHGDCVVPVRHNNKPLATWVLHQRRQHKKGELDEDRMQKLDSIGFAWDATANRTGAKKDNKWQENFKLLEQFKEEHGDFQVPQRSGSLGIWVQTQRQWKKNGKLDEERRQKLASIGFVWNASAFSGNAAKDDKWQEKFELLVQYTAEHGDCLVPATNKVLGPWVEYQRYLYKKKELPQDRLNKLISVGFVLDASMFKGGERTRRDELWQEKFILLKAYKEEHGNCLVPRSEGELGVWVRYQRRRRSNLSDDRVSKLNSIGFVWNASTNEENNLKSPPTDSPPSDRARSENKILPSSSEAQAKPTSTNNKKMDISKASSPSPKRRHKIALEDDDCNADIMKLKRLRKLLASQDKIIAIQKQDLDLKEKTIVVQEKDLAVADMVMAENDQEIQKMSARNCNKTTSNSSAQGRRGDPRMNRAVAARLENPKLSLFQALRVGGFEYSDELDSNLKDAEKVTLAQRKNQLSRRLRKAKKQQEEKSGGGGSGSGGGGDHRSTAAVQAKPTSSSGIVKRKRKAISISNVSRSRSSPKMCKRSRW